MVPPQVWGSCAITMCAYCFVCTSLGANSECSCVGALGNDDEKEKSVPLSPAACSATCRFAMNASRFVRIVSADALAARSSNKPSRRRQLGAAAASSGNSSSTYRLTIDMGTHQLPTMLTAGRMDVSVGGCVTSRCARHTDYAGRITPTDASTLHLSRLQMKGLHAQRNGGAIDVGREAKLYARDVHFAENRAVYGGAICATCHSLVGNTKQQTTMGNLWRADNAY